MLDDILQVAIITSLLAGTIRIATPILLAALGELITERSGVLNLGVEGIMLMGAFAGFTVAHRSGSLWTGVALALVAGGLMGLVMAFLVSTMKVDQTIAGLTLNLAAAGLSLYLYRVSFPNVGGGNLPNLGIFEVVPLPLLSSIPILGSALFSQYALTYGAFLLVPVVYYFLYHTKWGLELRCLGENPRALDLKGVNITLYQYLAVVFGAMLAGAGGGFLTLASAGMFVPDIAAGRGWIAIAIVIFGNWKPFNILLGAFFFGFLDAFQLQIQGLGFQIPYHALIVLPYLLTIVALMGSRHRSGAPIALGLPYHRE